MLALKAFSDLIVKPLHLKRRGLMAPNEGFILGGRRLWFICNAPGCSKRVAILYEDQEFACRECHGLAHPSQREQPLDRALQRAGRIRRRLGWAPGIANGHGAKPKHMHQRTFYDLVAKHDQFVQFSLGVLRKNLRRLQARLGYHR